MDHVTSMTLELDVKTKTLETRLSNHQLNIEIKATNMLKKNSKAFYQYARSKIKTRDSIGPLIIGNNELVNETKRSLNF